MAFLDKYFETIIETGYYNWLLDGFGNTLLITLGALLIGVVIGTVIAGVKYFGEDIAAMKETISSIDGIWRVVVI